MKNVFSKTNAVEQTNTRFAFLEPGRVFFIKDTAFVKLHKPMASNMRCDGCGLSVWNAHNFAAAVHFCPNVDRNMSISEFIIDFETPLTNETKVQV